MRRVTPSERLRIVMGRRRGDRDRRDIHPDDGTLFRVDRADHRFTAGLVAHARRNANRKRA